MRCSQQQGEKRSLTQPWVSSGCSQGLSTREEWVRNHSFLDQRFTSVGHHRKEVRQMLCASVGLRSDPINGRPGAATPPASPGPVLLLVPAASKPWPAVSSLRNVKDTISQHAQRDWAVSGSLAYQVTGADFLICSCGQADAKCPHCSPATSYS